jgi:biofilm PGA synthesis N-glycosyltransferase PgaC
MPRLPDPCERPLRSYCLISPCRNEQEHLQRAIATVLEQSARPWLWVIVDDGSTDETPRILAEHAARHDWIRIVRREDRGSRSVGPGVIDAFYAGYATIDPAEFEYLCKLDLDLELPPRYFESLMDRMEAEPRIGTCSGKAYYVDATSGDLVSEKCGDETSLGMTKFYRTSCFEQIGGFVRQVMWDGIDCHRCRMLGWIACSWDDPHLRFVHLRQTGSSDRGIWVGRRRHGFGQYFMGTGPVYMTASALYRMTRPPLVVGGAGMLWGYFASALAGKERYGDREFRTFLRRYQWDCLVWGKRAATARLDRRQTSKWRPDHPVVPREDSRRS